ncbi:hypothetical protein HDV02_002105 [Globomyces sp. JEL0801]|nr:hypothetical protein HDV02_002105 [Globomyces sp. JEL0801]
MVPSFLLLSLLSMSTTANELVKILEFDPPNLNIQDNLLNNKFKFRLKQKQLQPVQVFFEAAGVTFSKCSVEVGVEDFNQWKEIELSTAPVFDNRKETDVNIRARVFQSQTQIDQDYKCKRIYAPGGTCSSVGDPHYKLFNKIDTTHMGEGVFYLFRHDFLTIQATQGKCFSGKPTCNQAIAVRYGSSIMALDTRVGNVNNIKMTEITPNKDGIVYTAPNVKDSNHKIRLPCGSEIKFNVHTTAKDRWIDINMVIAPGYNNHGGICNQIGAKAGDLHCRTGEVVNVGLVDKFMKSWMVPQSENILSGQYRQVLPPAAKPGNVCKLPEKPAVVVPPPVQTTTLPPYVAPPKTTTSVPVTTTVAPVTTLISTTLAGKPTIITTTVPATTKVAPQTTVITTTIAGTTTKITTTVAAVPTTAPPATYTVPPPPPSYINQVEQHCRSLFNVNGCKSIVDVDFFVKSCITDATLTGSFVFAESSRLAFMILCQTTTQCMKQDVDPVIVQKALTIQKDCGLGNNSCINNCSGKGVCGNNGCRCEPGFGGPDCSINLTNLISYNPVTNQFSPNTAPVLLPTKPELPPKVEVAPAPGYSSK